MRNEKTKDIKQLDGEKIVRTYSRFDLVLKEGKGAMATDEDGNQLVDFTSGIGVTALGYCDDDWVKAVANQAATLQHTSNLYYTEPQEYVDICMNSKLATIRALDESARESEKIQKIVLMIDMGDLREGMFFADKELIFDAVREILSMENIELYGIGVNLTCYGAIIPKNDNLFGLSALGRSIEDRFGIKLNMISGGNSSSIYLIDKGEMPEGINNLRLGEAFLLGNDTAYRAKLPGTTDDAVILKAQVVELKEKPSLPIGEVGKDAFGQVPHYEDRGMTTDRKSVV